jgi:hypothetical protein
VWYPRNAEKLWEHGIGQDEVEDLVDQDNYVVDVHEDYPDQVRIIGRTGSGRLLTIALEDRRGGYYRPVTGWTATERERAVGAEPMTTKTTSTTAVGGGDDPARVSRDPEQGGPPDPVPEQRPWLTEEDTNGWRTVYRGTKQRRQVRSSVLVELTPEQRAWLDRAGKATGLLRHQLIAKLIDDARRADAAEPVERAHAAQ